MKLQRMLVLVPVLLVAGYAHGAVLFQEGFEDSSLSSRGWYDSTTLKLSSTEHLANSQRSVEYHFAVGATTPETSGGAIRRKFTESDAVAVSYAVKHSANWIGSNKSYHPHEIQLLTNADSTWWGPSESHLTAYIEENGGKPVLGIQDALNIDETRINTDLSSITEARAVAGCNGYATNDGSDPEDCYAVSSTKHRNWKTWRTAAQYFRDSSGSYYKGDWHRVEVFFRLNSIANGKAVADGILQYWLDGALLIDRQNVVYRTGQYPSMKFNQLLIAPYIGDGSPVDQTLWIDDLVVSTSRQDTTAPAAPGNLRVAP